MSDLDFKTALTERFRKGVAPLIGRDAVLWDLPYHNNIGRHAALARRARA